LIHGALKTEKNVSTCRSVNKMCLQQTPTAGIIYSASWQHVPHPSRGDSKRPVTEARFSP